MSLDKNRMSSSGIPVGANPANVPDDFPRVRVAGVVAGAQPKVCAVLSEGTYFIGQTNHERAERWDVCEDLAHQLIPKAQKDVSHIPNTTRVPPSSVCVSRSRERIGCCRMS